MLGLLFSFPTDGKHGCYRGASLLKGGNDLAEFVMREARQGVKPQRFTASLWLPLLALYDRFLCCFWQSRTFGVEENIYLRQGSYVSKRTQTNEQILMNF